MGNIRRVLVARLITASLFLIINSTLAGQFTSIQNGNWSSGSTWNTGTLPSSSDTVIIGSGTIVVIDANPCLCRNISFQSNTAQLSFSSETGELRVYGNFTIASSSHQAFATWTAGAKIRFAGNAATQLLSGWGTGTPVTSLMEVVIDKPSGKVVTSQSNMKFAFGTSLDIISGTFELATGDDIETRNTSGAAAAATVNIGNGGIFNMAGGSSYIRKGALTDPLTNRTGKWTVLGKATFGTTDGTSRINAGGIDIESGGEVVINASWSGSAFNAGTVTVKSGGMITNLTTSSVWHATSSLIINAGGQFNTLSATTALPSSTTSNGTFIYSAAVDQALVTAVLTYSTLVLSGSGVKTASALNNISITDSLCLRGSASLNMNGKTLTYSDGAYLVYNSSDAAQTTNNNEFPASGGPSGLIINNSYGVTLHAGRTLTGKLLLLSGTLNNGSANIVIAAGGTIKRSGGLLSASPVFGGTVNIEYANAYAPLTAGYELPAAPGLINNFTVSGGQAVTTGKNIKIAGLLNTDADIITGNDTIFFLSSAANPMESSSGRIFGRTIMLPRSVGAGSVSFTSLALQGSSNTGSVSIERVTGTAVSGESGQGISCYWKVSADGATPYADKYIVLAWYAADDNGKSFSPQNKARVWQSTDNGAGWFATGPLCAVSGNQRVLIVPFSSGGIYTVSDSLNPLNARGYSLSASVLFEGIWSAANPANDTVTAELRFSVPPYQTASSAKCFSSGSGNCAFQFTGIENGKPYYLAVRNRNSLETWSAVPLSFSSYSAAYDFTASQNSALGGNLILKDGRYCIPAGDINSDGIIDLADVILADNTAFTGASGYVPADLDGDGAVTYADIRLCAANALEYLITVHP